MYEIVTNIEILGSPSQVWHALIDFPSYPQWNPAIRSIEGKAASGQNLRVVFKPEGSFVNMKFWVVISSFIAEQELRWIGRLLFPALFAGDHYFLIQPLSQNRTKLIHGERFSGLFKPIFWYLLAKRNKAAFIDMNQALKTYVEGQT